MKTILKLTVAATFLFAAACALAEATPVEVDAAVAQMSSALYEVEFLAACGLATDEAQKEAIKQVAPWGALQKGLSRKLTTAQFVSSVLRARDKDLVISMQQRAHAEATPAECEKPEHRVRWDSLASYAKMLQAACPSCTYP